MTGANAEFSSIESKDEASELTWRWVNKHDKVGNNGGYHHTTRRRY
jgi:hypothetical protein